MLHKNSLTVWRLLRPLEQGPSIRQPILAVAVSMGLSETALASLLASHFVTRPPAPTPDPVSMVALCNEPFQLPELTKALDRSDGITFQMLLNLVDAEKARLLDCLNAVWNNGQVPMPWLTAIVVPILKVRKPAPATSCYRPVSPTSAVCKVMETMVLVHLQWITRVLEFFPEQQTGFRSRRCTADSIGDVVSTLEQARSEGEAALLVLLDVQSAFYGQPHLVVMQALDALGVSGRMEQFVRASLTGRSFRVRVGTAQSCPQPVTAGLPQRSVLSPFLFNVALARLSSSIPKGRRFPVHCSVYADDIALRTSGPRRSLPAVRTASRRPWTPRRATWLLPFKRINGGGLPIVLGCRRRDDPFVRRCGEEIKPAFYETFFRSIWNAVV
ncbi:hypothetical protein HPB49_007159 [Dermacentor silvarum]|uniref:Uncharacterized protein n=1 Tax=Dermacentor silvarum TaxID=543639 RepID=A0ACB8C2H1_DERSI|nr:hypothetical protein HPB49_007159 [Dermacentor silvarum]